MKPSVAVGRNQHVGQVCNVCNLSGQDTIRSNRFARARAVPSKSCARRANLNR